MEKTICPTLRGRALRSGSNGRFMREDAAGARGAAGAAIRKPMAKPVSSRACSPPWASRPTSRSRPSSAPIASARWMICSAGCPPIASSDAASSTPQIASRSVEPLSALAGNAGSAAERTRMDCPDGILNSAPRAPRSMQGSPQSSK